MKKALLIIAVILVALVFGCVEVNQNPNGPAPPKIIIVPADIDN